MDHFWRIFLISNLLQSTVYSLQSTVYSLQSTVYNLQSTVYSLQSTVSTVYILQSKSIILSLQFTFYNISLQSTVYILQSTVYSRLVLETLIMNKSCLTPAGSKLKAVYIHPFIHPSPHSFINSSSTLSFKVVSSGTHPFIYFPLLIFTHGYGLWH